MSGLVKFTHKGDFKKTERWLNAIKKKEIYSILNTYGEKGVSILREATPKRTGATAAAWSYRIEMEPNTVTIEWLNTNKGNDGRTPIALLIQLGHGTRNGGYVPPTDYINPAMKPLFDEIVEAIDKVVKSL